MIQKKKTFIYMNAFGKSFYPNKLTVCSSYTFYTFIYFLGIKPMTFALLPPCSNVLVCRSLPQTGKPTRYSIVPKHQAYSLPCERHSSLRKMIAALLIELRELAFTTNQWSNIFLPVDVHTHHITQSELSWKCLISLQILGISNHFLIVQQLLALDGFREYFRFRIHIMSLFTLCCWVLCLVLSCDEKSCDTQK